MEKLVFLTLFWLIMQIVEIMVISKFWLLTPCSYVPLINVIILTFLQSCPGVCLSWTVLQELLQDAEGSGFLGGEVCHVIL